MEGGSTLTVPNESTKAALSVEAGKIPAFFVPSDGAKLYLEYNSLCTKAEKALQRKEKSGYSVQSLGFVFIAWMV